MRGSGLREMDNEQREGETVVVRGKTGNVKVEAGNERWKTGDVKGKWAM